MMDRNVFTPDQEKWLAALESGEWRQGVGSQCRGGSYCCLGVASETAGLSTGPHYPTDEAVSLYRLHKYDGALDGDELLEGYCSLAQANDKGVSFSDIAAFIREKPWAVFTNFDAPEATQ